MEITKRFLGFHVLLAVCLILRLASCSGEKDIYDQIPSQSDYVASVDFSVILENSGVDLSSNKVSTSFESEKLLSDLAFLFADVHNSCNLSSSVVFSYRGHTFIHFPIVSRESLTETLEDSLSLRHNVQNGYHVFPYRSGAILIALKDGDCWIFRNGTSVADLDNTIRDADKLNINSVPFVREYLSEGSVLNVAVRSIPGIASGFRDKSWIVCQGDLHDNEMKFSLSSVDSIGKRLPIKGLLNVSPDYLRFLPSKGTMIGTVALGLDGLNIDWEKAFGPVVGIYGLQARGLMDYLLPFLGQIDGTIAVGVSTGDNFNLASPTIGDTRVVAMVHMNRQAIKKALQTIKNQLTWFGSRLSVFPDGGLKLDMDDYTVYATESDGFLMVSNYPVEESAGHEAILPTFVGECKGGVYIDISSMSSLFPGYPEWGMKISGQYRDDILRMTVKLTNIDQPVLKSLLEL